MIVFLVALFSLFIAPKESGERWKQLDHWMQPSGKVKVLSTTAMVDDIVRQVGGDAVESTVLIMGDMDPHSYEIVKGDAEKFDFADVVFASGLGLEHGASLRYRLARHVNTVNLGDTLPEKRIVKIDGMIDPHYWTDAELFSHIVEPIVETLSTMRPDLKGEFAMRGKQVKADMLALHAELLERVAKLPEKKRYLVTSHDAFHYFARAYLGGEDRFAAPEGLAPEGQMCLADLREIIDFLSKHKIHVVFPESNLSKAALQKIENAYEKVLVANTVLYGDAMGEKGSGAETYAGMMRHNVNQICEYLTYECD